MARKSKYQIWQKKRQRIKYRIMQNNIGNHPRLVVYRSNSNIYAQLLDDKRGITVLSASSIDKNIKSLIDKAANKIEKSKIVGETLAEKIKEAKISRIIFDRNGYKYHGRVKALSEAIRSAEITI
jgi:large subunit ribosomal protein L18|tara:strand:+ start:989 stop:1363 length:375 start_codon:yes stop_codon:yes gene_type:complete